MSTKSLITLLPTPPDPAPEQDFNGRALLLLAGAAHAHGPFDYERYRLTQEACRNIFGEKAL
ncbi:MAG: hypothetical protein IKX79_05285, partial [Desulfovibrionaceae bacterium]|nr:hypothetical protein [Desulfovibrionaceae bacterium]